VAFPWDTTTFCLNWKGESSLTIFTFFVFVLLLIAIVVFALFLVCLFCDPSFFCHNRQIGYLQLDAILIEGALSVDTIHRVNLIHTLVLPGASALPLELLLPVL
jgi:hypothetical protein